jgi:hypothetical protein
MMKIVDIRTIPVPPRQQRRLTNLMASKLDTREIIVNKPKNSAGLH